MVVNFLFSKVSSLKRSLISEKIRRRTSDSLLSLSGEAVARDLISLKPSSVYSPGMVRIYLQRMFMIV